MITDHCPHCIWSKVHPEDDPRPPAIIFLDMDGVMIGDRGVNPLRRRISQTLIKLFPSTKTITDYHRAVAKGRHLNVFALTKLNVLIEKIEEAGMRAIVVLSTAWRLDATLQQHIKEVFNEHNFSAYICGKTVPESKEIKFTPEFKQGYNFQIIKERAKSFNIKLQNRSDVIEFWLYDHGFNPKSTNFIVIDDCVMYKRERFGERFIEIRDLFEFRHLVAAVKALGIS